MVYIEFSETEPLYTTSYLELQNILSESSYFCDLGAHAKFRNPTTTPSGILVMAGRTTRKINLPKIVAYISLLRGCTHFARTNLLSSRLILLYVVVKVQTIKVNQLENKLYILRKCRQI